MRNAGKTPAAKPPTTTARLNKKDLINRCPKSRDYSLNPSGITSKGEGREAPFGGGAASRAGIPSAKPSGIRCYTIIRARSARKKKKNQKGEADNNPFGASS